MSRYAGPSIGVCRGTLVGIAEEGGGFGIRGGGKDIKEDLMYELLIVYAAECPLIELVST